MIAADSDVVGAGDGSFGSRGTVLVDFPGSSTAIAAGVAVDSQGRIVVAGRVLVGGLWRIGVARLTGTGALDTSFGSGGRVVTSFASASHVTAAAVVVDGSDRILVAGGADVASTGTQFALARYLIDGTLDTSFDGDGKVLTDWATGNHEAALALTFDGWGRIIAVGGVEQAGP